MECITLKRKGECDETDIRTDRFLPKGKQDTTDTKPFPGREQGDGGIYEDIQGRV